MNEVCPVAGGVLLVTAMSLAIFAAPLGLIALRRLWSTGARS